MSTSWYLTPYDIFFPRPGIVSRRPAMHRYYPTIPNADGVVWEEIETLGNHCVMKVLGPDIAHATLRADLEFLEFDPLSTIPQNRRNQVRNKLESIGFTTAEIDATGFVILSLIELLCSATGFVRLNAQRNGVEVLPGRRLPSKLMRDIDNRLQEV